jgi:hypothetical protein
LLRCTNWLLCDGVQDEIVVRMIPSLEWIESVLRRFCFECDDSLYSSELLAVDVAYCQL